MENGLISVGRDVVLQISKLLWCDSTKIRQIFGMCAEIFQWIKHPFFVNHRPRNIAMTFDANNCTMEHVLGNFQFWSDHVTQNLFLKKRIVNGIFQWKVKMNRRHTAPLYEHPPLALGCADFNLVKLNDYRLFERNGACCIRICEKGVELCGVTGVLRSLGGGNRIHVEQAVSDGSTAAIEANTNAQTLFFFVNGKKLPFGILGLPKQPLRFGAEINNSQIITSVSFRRLPSSTPSVSAVACRFYRFRPLDVKDPVTVETRRKKKEKCDIQ